MLPNAATSCTTNGRGRLFGVSRHRSSFRLRPRLRHKERILSDQGTLRRPHRDARGPAPPPSAGLRAPRAWGMPSVLAVPVVIILVWQRRRLITVAVVQHVEVST